MGTEQEQQRSRNVPAMVGLGINVLAVLLQVATSGVAAVVPMLLAQRTTTSLSEVAAIFAGLGVAVLLLLLHLAGGALGLVGLLAAASPRAMAGAALGVGAAGAVATLAGLVLPPLLGAVFSG